MDKGAIIYHPEAIKGQNNAGKKKSALQATSLYNPFPSEKKTSKTSSHRVGSGSRP